MLVGTDPANAGRRLRRAAACAVALAALPACRVPTPDGEPPPAAEQPGTAEPDGGLPPHAVPAPDPARSRASGPAPAPADPPARGRTTAPTRGADVTVSSADSLRLSLHAPDSAVQGSAVHMTLRATNVTDRTLELYLRGREIAFDLIVTTEHGQQVWRRLAGQAIPAILRLDLLEPGGSIELVGEWPQRSDAGEPVSPGPYLVRGELLTEGEPLQTPSRRLVVSPR